MAHIGIDGSFAATVKRDDVSYVNLLLVAVMPWATFNKILGTVRTHPTMAEANKYVADESKRAHAPPRLLAPVKRSRTLARA